MSRVFNFSAGPAMLPLPVLQQIQEEFLDFQGLGSSLIEISHRSKEFISVLDNADALFRELSGVPDNYRILYVHGGARMQFSAIPMNLLNRKPSKKALYLQTGNFAKIAEKDGSLFGDIQCLASTADTNYDHVPTITADMVDQDASYVHMTLNNTIYGTRWNKLPETGDVPLVADATSEILGREIDYSKFGMVYAGLQKNLGPSGLAVVVIREDLLGGAQAGTPPLMDYTLYEKNHSLTNTTNTFAIYVMGLVMQWLKDQGGVSAIEKVNNEKAGLLYSMIDNSSFYKAVARPDSRSMMNVTFNLENSELDASFLEQAKSAGLVALKGHRNVGGFRASIYNAMPIEGVQALVSFMKEFEESHG